MGYLSSDSASTTVLNSMPAALAALLDGLYLYGIDKYDAKIPNLNSIAMRSVATGVLFYAIRTYNPVPAATL
jgi:hypothetical protein